MPNHCAGDLLHTMAISGLSRVRTELFKLTVVQALTPHPRSHSQLELDFLLSDCEVRPCWWWMGRVHRLPNVVPRCRGAAYVQVFGS